MKLFTAKCHEGTAIRKQFTVPREMLAAVARDQRWPDVVAGISARFSKFAFVLFYYTTNHLLTDPLGTVNFVSRESQCFWRRSRGKHRDSRETKFTVPLGTSY